MSDYCCTDPACSHALFVAARKEASRLSCREREMILGVLRRDEQLRKSEEQRVLRLKAELQNLRRKGALKASTDWDSTTPDPDRSCGRCRVELGRVINRGAYCRSCRMKVCKSCREYSLRTTDWVCTVCHKRMEIQAASGEWMNEFVRRPSRRRDNRVYVPAADIIKRTIRRSWTISNPQPRWSTPRNSPLIRAYSSLPRGQDIDNYPYLASLNRSVDKSQKHNTACRSLSEDIYSERTTAPTSELKQSQSVAPNLSTPSETSKNSTSNLLAKPNISKIEIEPSITTETPKPPSPRINPLTKAAAEGKLSTAVPFEISISDSNKSPSSKSPKLSPRQTTQPTKIGQFQESSVDKKIEDKRVSFDEFKPVTADDIVRPQDKIAIKQKEKSILKPVSKSFEGTRSHETKALIHPTHSLPEEVITERVSSDLHLKHKTVGSNEQCDIEPISGTVFRKVTVRRRRQDMKKLPAIDNGRRKGRDSTTPDVLDILLPEGDDYKLVFVSSDSSSKEEDVDDNDSASSDASSFVIDECDWDYFEPSSAVRPLLSWSSPFGSPGVCRKNEVVVESPPPPPPPFGSPLVDRRRRQVGECDVSTDEDMARLESVSPASLDGTNYNIRAKNNKILEESGQSLTSSGETLPGDTSTSHLHHHHDHQQQRYRRCATVRRPENATPRRELCQSCGSPPTQYVPIPVPVPIPIPVPALWSSVAQSNLLARHGSDFVEQYLRDRLLALPFSIWSSTPPTSSCDRSAAFILPLITAAGGPGTAPRTLDERSSGDTHASNAAQPNRDEPSVAVVVADQNFVSHTSNKGTTTTCSSEPEKVDDCELNEKYGECERKVLNDDVCECDDAVRDNNYVDDAGALNNQKMSTNGVAKVTRYSFSDSQLSGSLCGHLTSENANMSSSDSSSDTSSNEGEENEGRGNGKRKVCRTYNISGGNLRESDDALPTSSSEVSSEDETTSSLRGYVKEDEFSPSSDSCDTESDDTGTVADQKIKHFSRVLVLNENSSSSRSSSSSSTSSRCFDENCASSCNDTDEEDDCGVVLTCVKSLEENYREVGNGFNSRHPSQNESQESDEGAETGTDRIERETRDRRSTSGEIVQLGGDFDETSGIDNSPRRLDSGDDDDDGVNFNSRGTPTRASLHAVDEKKLKKLPTNFDECLSPSPGLSDVSAESHHSSDVEVPFDYPPAGRDAAGALQEEASPTLPKSPVAGAAQNNTSTSANVRCDELAASGGRVDNNILGERAGAPVVSAVDDGLFRHAARYTSLVMITQEPAPSYPQVSVVTSDTTTLVADSDIVVRHTNWQNLDRDDEGSDRDSTLSNYFRLTLENNSPRRASSPQETIATLREDVTVVTGGDTLSAVVCHEDGLADDDSWVENLSNDGDDNVVSTSAEDSSSGEEVTLTCTAAIDHEDELRGYHRAAIDFTLHTIVEESCEDSEIEQPTITDKKARPTSVTDLEKYFFFGLSDGNVNSVNSNRDDAQSETSSICSESLDSLGASEETPGNLSDSIDSADLSSSRLEKYFLSDFMGFKSERRDSDGSVGSDSEGRPSPEQRRKRLVRARGTGRYYSSSLDNLLANCENVSSDQHHSTDNLANSDDISSSDTDVNDDFNLFEKSDSQLDTVKRKKNKKRTSNSSEELRGLLLDNSHQDVNDEERRSEDDGNKTPQPEMLNYVSTDSHNNNKNQSRDSGFVGSCDDLIKVEKDEAESKSELSRITEDRILEDKFYSAPPATSLTRKDSFNNWSSDEETNLMMTKVKQFFKTMVVNNCTNNQTASSKPGTPVLENHTNVSITSSPRLKNRFKPPQLVYFENELTRLMKTVPGIRDEQVRELVEYFSSEDTWSDSYDSSDYTSSDLEGASACTKTLLQQQISDSCQEIISKFEQGEKIFRQNDEGVLDVTQNVNSGVSNLSTLNGSPPSMASILHRIGSRLVALMHEVSSGESHSSNSPKNRHYHRRLHPKLSNASSTTTEDDDSTSDNVSDKQNVFEEDSSPYNLLPRSRSHDLLLSETKTLAQSNSGVSDITEEREASDYERFSWRGSFESALMATDSRNKLSLLGSEGSASASALAVAAKRRSAGDLMFNHKSLSREQLDRVRSCGSIGGGDSEDKLWASSAIQPNRRRSSVPDAASGSGGSADGEDDDEEEDLDNRATLPRSLHQNVTATAGTNSLPRLPTNTTSSSIYKAHSMYHFLQQNVKSARYRPPGFSKFSQASPKRASSAPGLQLSQQRRGRKPQQPTFLSTDDASTSEANSSPLLASRGLSKSATPSPVAHSNRRELATTASKEWHSNEDDIDRLVAIHHNRGSLSSLGLRSDSMASVYSGAGEGRYGTVAVRGQVEFGLQYNYKAGALEILVKQCKDLAAVDGKRNRSDPYVKVYLLPDKSKSGKRKTKVKKHTLNPTFDESLKFHISLNGLETRTLWLTVWHSDMFGRNDFLGEVMMTLENKVFDDPTPKWYNLQERTEPFEDTLSFKGDILVCLKFVPPDITIYKKGKVPKGALHVKVKEARSLMAVKTNGTSDPFCKSYLLPDKGRSSKQKTPVMRKTVNPVWNHTFVYENVTLQDLIHRCLELTVWDHDRLGSNEFLGGVRFSLGTGKCSSKPVDWMDSTGKEVSLWQSMLDRPNFWVEGCLPLRPTLDQQAT